MTATARLILCLILFVGVSAAFATPTDKNEVYLQQRLTHTLFQGVLASHFEPLDEIYDLRYFAHKSYLQTFMNEWSNHINARKFQSSNEIFAHIRNNNAYLARHYEHWEGLTNFRSASGRVDLGGYKQQFLNQVLMSELQQPRLEARIQNMLYFVTIFLTLNDQDDTLAHAIASPFLNNADPGVRLKAERVLSNISFEKKARMAVLAFNVLTIARASTGFLSAMNVWRAPRLLNISGLAAKMPKFKPPFANPLSAGVWTSTIAHGGGLGLLFLGVQSSESIDKTKVNSVAYQLPVVSIAKLWETLNQVYPSGFRTTEGLDFLPRFSPLTKAELINQVRTHLGHQTSLDYGSSFLQAEKIDQIDGRPAHDLLAMHFAQQKMNDLKSDVARLFGDQPITMEKIEAFRQYLLEGALTDYKRDFPNITGVFLGWGGNCVAQTMLMVALLEPYRHRLPEGFKLVVAIWPKHIEAGLWNGQTLIKLVEGTQSANHKGTLYNPEFLMVLLLRGYPGALDNLSYPDPRITPRSLDQGSRRQSGSGASSKSKKAWSKRPGVLDNSQRSDLSGQSQDEDSENGNEEDETPYAASMEYSRITSQTNDRRSTGGITDRMSERRGPQDPSKQKKVPAFNYSIHFVGNQGKLFQRFEFNHANKSVTVFDEALYSEFLHQRNLPKMTDAKFFKFIYEKRAEDMQRFTSSDILKKVYLQVHAAPDRQSALKLILELEEKDLKEHAQLIKEYSEFEEISESGTSRGAKNGRFDFGNIVAGSVIQSYRDFFNTFVIGEASLISAIARDPRLFLTVYNEAGLAHRNHLLLRFFGQSFWQYNKADSSDHKLIQMAKIRVRDFIANLSEVKIDFVRETNWICSKIKIDLPRLSPGSHWPADWIEYPDRECGGYTPPVDTKGNLTTNLQVDAGLNKMELKLSILIELTVSFGRGIHLWTAEAVDAFVDGRYSRIGPDRATSVGIVKSVHNSERQLMKDERYLRLKTLW